MENYICINGNKTKLTEEQLKQLGLEVKKEKNNPFTRHPFKLYWYINAKNVITGQPECEDYFDDSIYEVTNYFNDYKFAEQVALHQLLYRKLLKYSYDNNAEDVEWNSANSTSDSGNKHYFIYQDTSTGELNVCDVVISKRFVDVYFSKYDIACKAIEDVVEPFMKEHPEFVW